MREQVVSKQKSLLNVTKLCLAKAPKYPDLLHASIEDLARGLKHKRFTSVDLVNAYIAR